MNNKLEPLNEEKLKIFKEIISPQNDKNIFTIAGKAGTGKSLLLAHLIKAFKDKNLNMMILTPTHKAKNAILDKLNQELKNHLLDDTSFSSISTLAKFFNEKLTLNEDGETNFIMNDEDFKQVINKTLVYDLIVVDEASMIDSKNFMSLLSLVKEVNTLRNLNHLEPLKIIFSGDKSQLNPVKEDRNIFSAFIDNTRNDNEVKKFEINQIMRQQSKVYLKFLDVLRDEISHTTYESIPRVKRAIKYLIEKEHTLPVNERNLLYLNSENDLIDLSKNIYKDKQKLLDKENKQTIFISYTNNMVNKFNNQMLNTLNSREANEIKENDILIVNNSFNVSFKDSHNKSYNYKIVQNTPLKILDVNKKEAYLHNHLRGTGIKVPAYKCNVEININGEQYFFSDIWFRYLEGNAKNKEEQKELLKNQKREQAFMYQYHQDLLKKNNNIKKEIEEAEIEIKNKINNQTHFFNLLNLNTNKDFIYQNEDFKAYLNQLLIQFEKSNKEEYKNNEKRYLQLAKKYEKTIEEHLFQDFKKEAIQKYLEDNNLIPSNLEENQKQVFVNDISNKLNKIDSLTKEMLSNNQTFNYYFSYLKEVHYPYGFSVHKTQGSTYKNVIFDMDELIKNDDKFVYHSEDYEKNKVNLNLINDKLRLWYVAFTRHTNKFLLFNKDNKVKGLDCKTNSLEELKKVFLDKTKTLEKDNLEYEI